MSTLKRLMIKLEELEEEEEAIHKKLRFLKKERINKSDSNAKYELDQEIKEYEARLRDVDDEIEDLERQKRYSEGVEESDLGKCQTFDCLYKSLLKLGYWDQQNFFEEISGQHSSGVFLIQGKSKEYGQRWLLNRLALVVPNSFNTKSIIIDLNRTSARTDMLAVWDEFAGRLGLSEGTRPSQIARRICDLSRSQNVIVTFNNVDETIRENLLDLLNNFWGEITQVVSEHEDEENMFKIFIFLLDYQGVVSEWNLGFARNYQSDSPYPLELPEIHLFSEKDLWDWLNYQSDSLSLFVSLSKKEVLEMLAMKQGIPMPTLRKICDLCGCNWFEQEGKWLRL
jgi:hypothetical protein